MPAFKLLLTPLFVDLLPSLLTFATVFLVVHPVGC